MEELAPGAKLIQQLQDLGKTDEEINGYRTDMSLQLRALGKSEEEINWYWGSVEPEGSDQGSGAGRTIDNLVQNNLKVNKWSYGKLPYAHPDSWWTNFWAGNQFGSVAMLEGRRPTMQMHPEASFGSQLSFGAGQAIGDFFPGVAGAVPGLLAKERHLAGFGAFAAPEMIRRIQLDRFENGDYAGWTDTIARLWQASKHAAYAGVGGAAAAGLGPYAYAVAKPLGSALASTVEAAAMGVAATGVTSVLEGTMPSVNDFIVAAALGAIIPGGMAVSRGIYTRVGARQRIVLNTPGRSIDANLKRIYQVTGIKPDVVAQSATKDPVVHQQMTAQTPDGEAITGPWKAKAPPEVVRPDMKVSEEVEAPAVPEKPGPLTTPDVADTSESGVRPLNNFTANHALALVEDVAQARDAFVSTTGAVGRYQIDPTVARNMGFDPSRLGEPGYAKQVGKAVFDRYAKQFKNEDGTIDTEAVLIAWFEGESAAQMYRATGRNYGYLSIQTQRALERAGDILDGVYTFEAPKTGRALTPIEALRSFSFSRGSGRAPTLKELWRMFKYEYWSELDPLKNFDKLINMTEKDLGLTDMARGVYGSQGMAVERWRGIGGRRLSWPGEKAGYDLDGSPTFEKAIQAGDKAGDGFDVMLVALDTLDRAAKGMKTAMSAEEATTFVTEAGHKYDNAISMWRSAFDSWLTAKVDAGLISPEMAAHLRAEHPNYIVNQEAKNSPRYAKTRTRFGLGELLTDIPEEMMDPAVKTAARVAKPEKPSPVIHPYNATIALLLRSERFEMVNYMRKYAVGLIRKNVLGEGVDAQPFGRVLPEDTVLGELLNSDGTFNEDVVIMFENRDAGGIRYFEDGKLHSFKVPDFDGADLLVHALMSMQQVDPGLITRFMTTIMLVARSGTVEVPSFIARSISADISTSAILAKRGVPAAISAVASTLEIFGAKTGKGPKKGPASEIFNDFVANGGANVALNEMGRHHLLDEWARYEDAGMFKAYTGYRPHPILLFHDFYRSTDSIMRLGLYKSAISAGVGKFKAGIEARKGVSDYGERAGNQMVNLAMLMTPFYRSSVRGLDVAGRAIRERPVRTFIGASIWTMAVIGVYFLNERYEDATNMPEMDRQRNRPIETWDHGIPVQGPLGTLFLRGPFNVQPISGLAIRAIEWARTERPDAFKHLGDTVLREYLPPGLAPGLGFPPVKFLIEMMTGFDPVTGYPVIPRGLDGLYGYMQYRPYQSIVAQRISEALGPRYLRIADVSPVWIDKFIADFGGTAGTAVARIADPYLAEGEMPTSMRPSWYEVFVGSWDMRHPGNTLAPVQEFYDNFEDFSEAKKSKEAAERRGDMALAREIASDPLLRAKEMGLINPMRVAKALSEARRKIEEIWHHKTMSGEDKQQLIDQHFTLMLAAAQRENEKIRSLRKKR